MLLLQRVLHSKSYSTIIAILVFIVQLNLTLMNNGYNELPDITIMDLRMYAYLLYCE